MEQSLLEKREQETDHILYNTVRVLIGLLVGLYGMKFVLEGAAYIATFRGMIYYSQIIFLVIPIVYYKKIGGGKSFRYITLSLITLCAFILYFSNWMNSAIACITTVFLASLYDDKKMTNLFATLNIVGAALITAVILQLDKGQIIMIDTKIMGVFGAYLAIQIICITIIIQVGNKKNSAFLQESMNTTKQVSSLLEETNNMSERLEKAVSNLSGSISEVNTGIGTVNRSVEDILLRTTESLKELSVTDDTIVQVTNRINTTYGDIQSITKKTNKIMESTIKNKDLVGTIVEDIRGLGELNTVTVAVIHELVDKMTSIREAVDLINAVATQTTLLSLNASIEAARAGEAGKGFTIVASEIQKLSNQSREASNTIQTIVEAIGNQIDNVVANIDVTKDNIHQNIDNIDEMAQGFEEVYTLQEESLGEIDNIERELKYIHQSGEEIAMKTSDIRQNSDENAVNVQEISKAIDELSRSINAIDTEIRAIV